MGRVNLEWLRTFLTLPLDIPPHDPFGGVLARLDPKQFERRFFHWIRAVRKLSQCQVVAIDGRELRRSQNRACGQKAFTLVSAWATAN